MPKKIGGKELTEKEHEIWKAVFQKTGSGAMATKAVERHRKGKKR